MAVSRRKVLSFAAALGLCGEAAAAEGPGSFPFRVTRNRPWTVAFFDRSKEPHPVLIDTGSNLFAINPKVAASAGLRRVAKGQVQTLIGRADVPIYQANEVLIANTVRERDVYLAGVVLDGADTVSGMIPAPMNGVTAFDFDALTVTMSGIHVPDLSGYARLPYVATGSSAVSGSVDRMGEMSAQDDTRAVLDLRPTVEVELDGRMVPFLVDTGCSDALVLSPEYVKANGLWEHHAGAVETKMRTLVDTVAVKVARADSLKIGPVRFLHPIITIPDPNHGGSDAFSRYGGIVGMELLRRLNLVADPFARRLWVKPNAAIIDVYRYDRAGADIDVVDGVLRVTWLAEGGPAARAGLKLSDRVSGWAGPDSYHGLLWALKGAPGATVRIQVERDGGPQVIEIKLEELI